MLGAQGSHVSVTIDCRPPVARAQYHDQPSNSVIPLNRYKSLAQTNPTVAAIALMIGSSICFAVMHTLIRYSSDQMDPLQIAFFRNVFGFLIFIPVVIQGGGFGFLKTKRLGLHTFRAVLNVGAMLCFFTALSMTEIAKVTALGFTAPICTAILSVILLGERFRFRRWSAILIGFAGMLIIMRPGLIDLETGPLLVLAASALWGVVIITIKVLSRTESSLTITGYMNLLLAILSFGPALYVWTTPDLPLLGILVVIGIIGTLAQLVLAEALKIGDVTVVLPFDFLRLIWAALLGYLVFAEVPDIYTWIGGAVIFSSTFYLAYRENRIAKSGTDQ